MIGEKPSLKQLVGTGKPKFGIFLVEFATPGIGYILKGAGCDFVVVDMEHSGFGIDTVKALLRSLEAAGLPAFVGPATRTAAELAPLLDIGADGVISPMVGSEAEAADAISRTKYPPVGRRAVSVQVGHDRYQPGPVVDKLAAANASTVYFSKIETAEGVEAVDRIAALDGLDGLWLGHYDLSVSLGIPGQFDNPAFVAAVSSITEAARTHGRSLGRIVTNPEEGRALIAAGFDFICYSGDAWLLQSALADGIAAMRG